MISIYAQYFPFYEDSLHTAPRVAAVDVDRIFFPPELRATNVYNRFLHLLTADPSGRQWLLSQIPSQINFHRIQPLNLYLPQVNQWEAAALKVLLDQGLEDQVLKTSRSKTPSGPTSRRIDGAVTVFDYSTIVDEISMLESPEGGQEASYLGMSGVEKMPLVNSRFVELAVSREAEGNPVGFFYSASPQEVDTSAGNFIVRPSSVDDAVDFEKLAKQGSKRSTANYTVSAAESVLEKMLQGKQSGIKGVPCLTGLSGVAKSSIIKKVADRNNWRMVDFRAAFLHRLDMEGMFYLVDPDDKLQNYSDTDTFQKFSRQAYLGDFVKVSDQYTEYAKRMEQELSELREAKPGSDLYDHKKALEDDGKLGDLDKLILKFHDEARPPLLFFDEIVRASLKILNLFTILLNDKKLGDLTFKKAKICAAANTPHGMEFLEDGQDLFVGQASGDPAIYERLKVIPVTPTDMFPSWYEFITKSGWDELIIKYLDPKNGGLAKSYGLDYLNDPDVDINLKKEATYPTFRAWELIDRAMKEYRKSGLLTQETLKGILGERHYESFQTFIKSNGVSYSLETPMGLKVADDTMSSTLEANLAAGIPYGMFGPSGLGKSARVNALAAARGWQVETIQMANKSPADIMGAPSLLAIETFLAGDSLQDFETEGSGPSIITQIAKAAARDIEGLPAIVTMRSHDGAMRGKLEEIRSLRAAGIDAKMVLFFDEVNRIAAGAESVQSAIFEAISDNRYAGVDFDPDEVAIVMAANVDWEVDEETFDVLDRKLMDVYGDKPTYGGTKPIGSALKLRVCSTDNRGYSLSDVASVRNYVAADTHGFHPTIRKFFKRASDEDIVLWLRSTEYKTLMNNVPSTRSFDSLSSYMFSHPEDWTGMYFFPSAAIWLDMILKISDNPDMTLFTQWEALNKPQVAANWVALNYADSVNVNFPAGGTPQDLMEVLSALQESTTDTIPVFTDAQTRALDLSVTSVYEVEQQTRATRKQHMGAFIGFGEEADKLGVVDSLLDMHNELSSNIADIEPEGIVDRTTAAMWVKRALRDELNPDVLLDQDILPCLGILSALKRYDPCMFVILELLKQGIAGKGSILAESAVRKTPIFTQRDAYFSQFNDDLVKAISSSPSRSFGPKWDILVQDYMSEA